MEQEQSSLEPTTTVRVHTNDVFYLRVQQSIDLETEEVPGPTALVSVIGDDGAEETYLRMPMVFTPVSATDSSRVPRGRVTQRGGLGSCAR